MEQPHRQRRYAGRGFRQAYAQYERTRKGPNVPGQRRA
jgi:hypothetical protein